MEQAGGMVTPTTAGEYRELVIHMLNDIQDETVMRKIYLIISAMKKS